MPTITHRLTDTNSRSALIAIISNVAFKGSVPGAAVRIPVHFDPVSGDGTTRLYPSGLANYVPQVSVNSTRACAVTISEKGPKGFTVTLSPLSDRDRVADGALDVAILA